MIRKSLLKCFIAVLLMIAVSYSALAMTAFNEEEYGVFYVEKNTIGSGLVFYTYDKSASKHSDGSFGVLVRIWSGRQGIPFGQEASFIIVFLPGSNGEMNYQDTVNRELKPLLRNTWQEELYNELVTIFY